MFKFENRHTYMYNIKILMQLLSLHDYEVNQFSMDLVFLFTQ